MASRFQRQGQFPAYGFSRLLRHLVSELALGQLVVTQGGVTRRMWLEAGQVCAVVSEREEEKLGAWLVRRGVLQGHHMAVALLRQPEGVRFGTFLVTEKLLDIERLVAELAALSVTIVSRSLFDPGSYEFLSSDTLPRDAASLDLSTASLLVAAVRAVEEPARLQPLVPPDAFLWGAQDALLKYQHVRLSSHEAYLLTRINGQMTTATLQRVVPLPKEQVTLALAALVVAGLVEVRQVPMPRPEVAAVEAALPARLASQRPTPPAGQNSPAAPARSEPSRRQPSRPAPPPPAPSAPPPPAPAPKAPAKPVFKSPPRSAAPSFDMAPARSSLPSLHVGEPEPEEHIEFTPEQAVEHADVLRFASNCQRLDSYSRLGLPPGTKGDVVTIRFRDLVRRYHPDRANEPHLRSLRRELGEISAALLEAYEAITGGVAAGDGAGAMRATPAQPEPMSDEARRHAVREKVNTARRLLRKGDPAQATELLDQAVRLAPDPKTLLFLARVEFHHPMWVQRGLDHLRHAVSMDPQFTEGWLELANYWGTRGQVEKQRQCLERILTYDPRNRDVRDAIDSIITSRPAHPV